MRLLFLAPHPFFQNRGTPIADLRMLEYLSERGHDVHMLTLPEGEDVSLPGLTIYRLPKIPGLPPVPPGLSVQKVLYDILLLWHAWRLARRLKPDLVHAVEEAALVGVVLKKLLGVPYVYDMDSSLPEQLTEKGSLLRPLRPLFEHFEAKMVRKSEGVLAVCSELGKDARRHGDVLVQVAEDTSILDPETQEPAEDLRSSYGLTGPIILYVGNLEWYQGIDLLLEAFQQVAEVNQSARLVIVGGAERHIAQYRSWCERAGIADRVTFTGPKPIEQLVSLLEQADVLVSPRSAGRNTPMKVFSYMESGTPIVATRRVTHTQVLTDDSSVLVEPEPGAYAQGLLRLLTDPKLSEEYGLAVQERFEKHYSQAAARAKHDRFLREVETRINTRA